MSVGVTDVRPKSTLVGPTDEQIADFSRDGFCVARGLFSADEVMEIRDVFMQQAAQGHVDGLFDQNSNRDSMDPLDQFPRMMQPHRRPDLQVGQVAMKYMLDARVEAYLTALTASPVVAAQSMFYYKPGGARGQALHQDNFYLRVKPGTCYAAWAAIDAATVENGGLMVVPGSHREEIACPAAADPAVSFTTEFVAPPEGTEPVPVELAAGDVLFFGGSVIHGSYPNNSADFRRAFICHYVPEDADEVSTWYHPLLGFDGHIIEGVADATGGGPCGTPDMVLGPH